MRRIHRCARQRSGPQPRKGYVPAHRYSSVRTNIPIPGGCCEKRGGNSRSKVVATEWQAGLKRARKRPSLDCSSGSRSVQLLSSGKVYASAPPLLVCLTRTSGLMTRSVHAGAKKILASSFRDYPTAASASWASRSVLNLGFSGWLPLAA
jgi:hypothetical protein